MVNQALLALLLLAVVGTGLIGGLFFTFSTFVMQALDRLPPAQAIAAMQSINVTVLNPLFFTAFFGTALLTVLLAAWISIGPGGPDAVLIALGVGAYLLGTILVTMRRDVPLNNALERIEPGADLGSAWADYRIPWTRWNHVRTVSSLAASTAFAAALA